MTGSVRDTLREMWESRPTRPRHGRKIAGVSAAIGQRYGIDPVLVRVGFIVALLTGGAGIALYLLGWLVLPPEQSQVTSGTRQALSVLGVVLVVLFGAPIAFASLHSLGLVAFAAGLAALFLLHRNYQDRAVRGPAAEQPQQDNVWVYRDSAVSDPAAPDSAVSDSETASRSKSSGEPPAWDPLGAAPFAWDLPEPSETSGEPPRKRHWITWGTALFAVLAAVAVVYEGGDGKEALAIALGVLGAGMLAGAFLHGGRGLIAFALPVGALALLLGTAEDHRDSNYDYRPPQVNVDRMVVAASPADLERSYQGGSRLISLDLRPLRMPAGESVATSAGTSNGVIRVLLPPNMDVTAECSAYGGSVDCLGSQADGSNSRINVTDDGPDGPGGGHIELDLTTASGRVEVLRG